MPKCDFCRAEGATQRCSKCQGCWSCNKACSKKFWRTHKKFCTDDPALKPHVPIELAFERALAEAPKMTEPPPENATCYICLDTEGPQDGGKVMRACACRGPSAGFAHVDCLVEMASRNEWIDLNGGDVKSRWLACPTCHSNYFGALSLELSRRRWRMQRNAPVSEEKQATLAMAAREMRLVVEFDAADRLDEDSSKCLGHTTTPDERLAHDLLRANGLVDAHRFREALESLNELRPRVEQHSDDPNFRTLYTRAMTISLAKLGRLRESLPFAVEAVQSAMETPGPESQFTFDCILTHAEILAELGQYGQAKATVARVLATRTRVLGANHPKTLRTRRILDSVS